MKTGVWIDRGKGWAGWWDLADEKGWKDILAKHLALILELYSSRKEGR
jgi:hypothetical protein